MNRKCDRYNDDNGYDVPFAEHHFFRVLPSLVLNRTDQQALSIYLKVFSDHLDCILDFGGVVLMNASLFISDEEERG